MNKRLFWVFALSSVVYFNQGIENLPSQGLFYYLKETLALSPEKIMLLGSVTTLAWLIKPIIGYVIDNFLTKKTWILIAITLDIVLALVIGIFSLPIILIVTILVINSTNAAFRDVSVDGIMCVEGKEYNATGKIQSVQWISISIAGLINGILGGYIAYRWDYKTGFLFLIPFYFIVVFTALFYKDEARDKGTFSQRSLSADLKRIFADKKLLIIALFIFLYRYSPSFGTPLFFIQRDVFKWSKVWIGTLASIAMVFQILGALLYYRFSQRINIKKLLYISVFLGAIITLSYLHYNPLTAVLYDIAYSFIGMFIFIMVMDFMARNTVRGLEATSFAFLCSVSNLALLASNLSGAVLFPVIGLKWLIIISAFASFLCLALISKIE